MVRQGFFIGELIDLYTNRMGCTIYEKTIRNRSPTYIRRAIGAVYWEEKLERADGADRSPHGEVFISIPSLSAGNYVPKTDDRIVGEIITDEQPPNTALTITAVSDLRFGSDAVRHIEVTAKC